MGVRNTARRALRPTVRQVANRIVSWSDLPARMVQLQHDTLADRLDLSAGPTTEGDRNLRILVEKLAVRHRPLHPLVRVGDAHDGGYVMADCFDHTTALSVGVGWDDSWDAAVLARGCSACLQFDHTIRRPPRRLPRTRFYRMGLTGQPDADPRLRTLPEILALPELAGDGELTVKIDIEGSEWAVLGNASDSFLRRTRQLVVELHEWRRCGEPGWAASASATLERLNATHRVVNVHANNAVPLFGTGTYATPDAVEVSFVRADLTAEGPSDPATRSRLNAPNDPRIGELDLSTWPPSYPQ